jgi:transposase
MNDDWLSDGRKVPDDVMSYFRKAVVRAVKEKGYSPELVAEVFGFSRSCVYDWLARFDREGYEALETRVAPGAEPKITEEIEDWLKEVVLNSTPMDHGYDTVLWTRDILAQLVKQYFQVEVSGNTVSMHLKKMRLTYQKPRYQAVEQDPQEVDAFLNRKFPMIQRLADKLGAAIAFEDEAGVGLLTRAGRTWGQAGQTPRVVATDQRGGYNVLSLVTAEGKMSYSIKDGTLDSERYIEFLKQLLRGRDRPLIVLADRASFHKSKQARDFVRSNRTKIRVFFLPKHAPERNPAEQVWEEIKDNNIGRRLIRNKVDLKAKLSSALKSLQRNAKRIKSFFQLPDTQYTGQQCLDNY